MEKSCLCKEMGRFFVCADYGECSVGLIQLPQTGKQRAALRCQDPHRNAEQSGRGNRKQSFPPSTGHCGVVLLDTSAVFSELKTGMDRHALMGDRQHI